MAKRIQMSRQRPWRADNPGAVVVARGTKWGNPCKVEGAVDREYASAAYSGWIAGDSIPRELYGPPPTIAEIRAELAGKDLACWCPLHRNGEYVPCHADVLISIANDIPMDEVIRENLRRAEGETL